MRLLSQDSVQQVLPAVNALLLTLALLFPAAAETDNTGVAAATFAELTRAAETGDPIAQRRLADAFAGSSDSDQALAWYQKAAQLGDARAQWQLGRFYDFGAGSVEVNRQAAFKWYQKAASQGCPDAQIDLGHFCEQGLAGEPDLVEAFKWYTLASLNDSVLGKVYRDRLASRLEPQQLVAGQLRAAQAAPIPSEVKPPVLLASSKQPTLSGEVPVVGTISKDRPSVVAPPVMEPVAPPTACTQSRLVECVSLETEPESPPASPEAARASESPRATLAPTTPAAPVAVTRPLKTQPQKPQSESAKSKALVARPVTVPSACASIETNRASETASTPIAPTGSGKPVAASTLPKAQLRKAQPQPAQVKLPKVQPVPQSQENSGPSSPKVVQAPEPLAKTAAALPGRPTPTTSSIDPAVVSQLRLKAISAFGKRRGASINNRTLLTGEEADFNLNNRVARIRCVEVKSDSAIIELVGVSGKIELKLVR